MWVSLCYFTAAEAELTTSEEWLYSAGRERPCKFKKQEVLKQIWQYYSSSTGGWS